jgi:hypothetical protein
MRIVSWVVPAVLLVGCAGSKESPVDAGSPQAKAPPVEYRSAFDGYQSFAERELIDWRKANAEVVR